MYELVRVDDQFRMIERNSSPGAPVLHRLPSDNGGPLSPLWTPCRRAEKRSWTRFVKTGIAEENHVAKPILESWKRCKEASVEVHGKCRDLIDGSELDKRRSLLCEISEPIIETLRQCLRGTRFIIVLVDKEGYILASLGDSESLRHAEKLNFGPGANWSEFSVGTNAIGTALAIGCSVQVTGSEHYCEDHHAWTCSATPIRNAEGNVMGCLDISGPREEAHFHSPGMTAAAVRAIEERFRLEQSHQYYRNASTHLASVFSSVSEGLISIDNSGAISGINAYAARLLGVHPDGVIGSEIGRVMRMDSKLRGIIEAGRGCSEEVFHLEAEKGPVRCVGSVNKISGQNGSKLGTVFTFNRMKEKSVPTGATGGSNSGIMFGDIIGESCAMQETLEKAKRIAGSPSTVLILGESGTGKELFAHAIHNASDRKGGPFVSVNCGAIPAELIQSELFGYAEGAFTGARKGGRIGKIEQANGGSVFLDEIGDMPLQMQVNLLRFLEDKAIVRVGDNRVVPVDVRIIAATNRSLYEEVVKGKFREDLFYRLNVVTIILPPLRERKGDIPLLTNYFVEMISGKVGKRVDSIDPSVFAAFEAHQWPGNVRELTNAIEYALNLLQQRELQLAHLPPYLKKKQTVLKAADNTSILSLALVEKKAIENALSSLGGNISKVAAALGIGRNTLYDKMRKHGIRV
ncbi:MAG: sigma-54-dependent Fis family transcriptional regulator [Syntrophobacteraceae bacterium]